MIIKDQIYGNFKIKNPIIKELINTPSLNRLKSISQYGVPDKYYHHTNFSRYEHSVGVMLLLRKLGAPLEEQIAGLLHDISTFAFSHAAEWAFGEGRQGIENLHETIKGEFLKQTSIPQILRKYKMPTSKILNENNFPLLEKEIPNLCADRIDYSLREFKYWLKPKDVAPCLNSLQTENNEIIFNNKEAALKFAQNYLTLQTKHWGEEEAIIRYYLFSEVLKIALGQSSISRKEFYGLEEPIVKKIKNSKNQKIKKLLKILKRKKIEKKELNFGTKVRKKFRFVDPKIVFNGKATKLSNLDSSFKRNIEKAKKKRKDPFLI